MIKFLKFIFWTTIRILIFLPGIIVFPPVYIGLQILAYLDLLDDFVSRHL